MQYFEVMSVQAGVPAQLVSLLEELADAALETVPVLLGEPDDDDRAGQARYLQDLHRVAQATLARTLT